MYTSSTSVKLLEQSNISTSTWFSSAQMSLISKLLVALTIFLRLDTIHIYKKGQQKRSQFYSTYNELLSEEWIVRRSQFNQYQIWNIRCSELYWILAQSIKVTLKTRFNRTPVATSYQVSCSDCVYQISSSVILAM